MSLLDGDSSSEPVPHESPADLPISIRKLTY